MTPTHKRKIGKKSSYLPFDKYDLYRRAVQSPDGDVEFYAKTYRELRKKKAFTFREDFCGTFALSAEWVKLGSRYTAHGLDIDPEPMDYGRRYFANRLTASQQGRLHVQAQDVLVGPLPSADIVAAVNFSYFCFKTRDLIKKYFTNVYKSLKPDGIFVTDLFGGSQCQDTIEDVHKHGKFTYYWDQVSFNPVDYNALFQIHFRVGGKKYENVFTYDWRMWTIPEIREIMTEVGFKNTHVYWEGTNRQGGGNGIFSRTEEGEACLSWIAYVVGAK